MELCGHFIFGGIESLAYGLILANVETDRNVKLSGDIETQTVFGRKNKRYYYAGDNYDDSAFSLEIDIVSDDDRPLSYEEQREISKWLFYNPGYRKLYLDPAEDWFGENEDRTYGSEKYIYLNCRFTHPEKIEGNGGIVGYRATLEADSAMAWADETNITYTLSTASTGETISVYVDSDLQDYIYPKVTFVTGSTGGNVSIVNQSDSATRFTAFTDLGSDTQVIMNGDINTISGNNYQRFTSKNFVRLLDGENRLTITGDVVSVQLRWQNRRYI